MGHEDSTTSFAPASRRSPEEIGRQWDAVASVPLLVRLMNTVPDAMVVLNDCRQIVFANRAFGSIVGASDVRALAGLRPGEAVGCLHSDVREAGCGTSEFCEKCGAVRAILNSQGGRADVQECRISLKNGEALDLQVHAAPFQFDGSDFTVFSVVDRSSEKRRRVLERIFFHDVLNTAGGLYGLADVRTGAVPEDDEAGRFARTVYALSRTIVEEIEAQRTLAAAESSELVLQKHRLQSQQMLEEVAAAYRHHEVARGKTVNVDSASVARGFSCDRMILRRVLGNLLKNALEASHKGDCVTMRCRVEGDVLLYEVHNPTFMPRDIQLQIFKRSFSTKGTDRGIGTYSIKLLTEKYLGGRVTFTSSEVAGTTFQVSLPPDIWSEDESSLNSGAPPLAQARRPAEGPSVRLDGSRVLLAEDSEINQQIVVALLENAGARVDVTANGREALEQLTSGKRYNVLLLDLQMPEMDGYETTAAIRSDPRLACLPIVAMTAHGTVEERNRCQAAGMDGHVPKPIEPGDLLQALQPFCTLAPGEDATPSVPETSVRTVEVDLPQVEGLDARDGLRRVAGNLPLYRKLLRRFASEQAEAPSRIQDLMMKGQVGDAARVAHTLKGVSGNIGAPRIQALAASLERVCAPGREAREVEVLCRDLAIALGAFVIALKQALGPEARVADTPIVAPDRLQEILEELRQLLQNSDPAACDCLEAHRSVLAAALPAHAFAAFEQHVQNYAFDEAMHLLEQSRGSLK
jgi:CheY-like chemotaxis protein/signal transduction histidine kinase/HPt (histidine-containing phosphotransfer) domain-containing protein